MIKIAICDDDAGIRDNISALCHKYCHLRENIEVSVYATGEELLQALAEDFDLIYLDIGLPGQNGLAIAEQIRQVQSRVLIIFLTGYFEYAIAGYRLNIFRYHTKPIQPEIFQQELLDAMTVIEQRHRKNKIALETQIRQSDNTLTTTVIPVTVNDIYYLHIVNKKVEIVTVQGIFQSTQPMKYWEERLHGLHFYEPSSKILVNEDHVLYYNKELVQMTNGDQLPMSRYKAAAFRQYMAAAGDQS